MQNKFAFYQGHKMKHFGHLIFSSIQEERISIQTIDFPIIFQEYECPNNGYVSLSQVAAHNCIFMALLRMNIQIRSLLLHLSHAILFMSVNELQFVKLFINE